MVSGLERLPKLEPKEWHKENGLTFENSCIEPLIRQSSGPDASPPAYQKNTRPEHTSQKRQDPTLVFEPAHSIHHCDTLFTSLFKDQEFFASIFYIKDRAISSPITMELVQKKHRHCLAIVRLTKTLSLPRLDDCDNNFP